MDIKEIINQRYAMPDASLDRLRQCLTEVSYPKGFRVLESGKVEKNIFFIDGKEITFWVGKEGATIVSMKGYVNDEPGYETMELMEDSVLYVLERKKLKVLFSEDLHIANWGRRYAEMELLATEERLISMLSAIASERYKELLEKEPDLLQRLPLGSIAIRSYTRLGRRHGVSGRLHQTALPTPFRSSTHWLYRTVRQPCHFRPS